MSTGLLMAAIIVLFTLVGYVVAGDWGGRIAAVVALGLCTVIYLKSD